MFLSRPNYFVLKDHLFIVNLLFLFVFSLLWLKTFSSLSSQLGKGKEKTPSGRLIAMSLEIQRQLAQSFLCLETFFTLGWSQICCFPHLYDLRTFCQTSGLQTLVCFRLSQQASLLKYTFLDLQGISDSASVGGESQEPEF